MAITIKEDSTRTTRFLGKGIYHQRGIVVELNKDSGIIYSTLSGISHVEWGVITNLGMRLGSFVRYNASLDERTQQWIAERVEHLGEMLEIVPYLMRKQRLQLRIEAVVNRMDMKTSCLWLWNDHLGRIHVPPLYFLPTLKPLDVVSLIAMYDGEYEDVPWTGIGLKPLKRDEMDRKRTQLTTLLHTSDGWKMSPYLKMHSSTVGFHTFLTHESTRMNAFAAWTDFTKGETPLAIGTEFRVTWLEQKRFGKHDIRAVMVTPIAWKREMEYHHLINPSPRLDLSIQIPRLDDIGVNRERFDSMSTNSTISSSSPTTSEDMMMCSRNDQFRQRFSSTASSSSLSSCSPSPDFTPIFNSKEFVPWYPIEKKRNTFH